VLLEPAQPESTAAFRALVRSRHPRFSDAVIADARLAARHRGDRREFPSRADGCLLAVRLSVVSDSFLAQVCYRAKAACNSTSTGVSGRRRRWSANRGEATSTRSGASSSSSSIASGC